MRWFLIIVHVCVNTSFVIKTCSVMVINTKPSSLLPTYNLLCWLDKASANRNCQKFSKFEVNCQSCLLTELLYFRNNLLSGHVGLHQQHPQCVLEIEEASPLLPPTAGHQVEVEETRNREKRWELVDLKVSLNWPKLFLETLSKMFWNLEWLLITIHD